MLRSPLWHAGAHGRLPIEDILVVEVGLHTTEILSVKNESEVSNSFYRSLYSVRSRSRTLGNLDPIGIIELTEQWQPKIARHLLIILCTSTSCRTDEERQRSAESWLAS
jgi:hypothetical protein